MTLCLGFYDHTLSRRMPPILPCTGIVVAIVSSVIFKTGYFQADNMLEPMLVILFAFSSYMMAEALKLSGIVSILFCGMVGLSRHRPPPLFSSDLSSKTKQTAAALPL